MTVCNLYL